ncbi:octapeptide-repeat protein T2-like [Eleutherodactylus coqui]|uniref:octapeptide-repeat protein T2-like n=1 Tax=Eleutherodactylus coqui TaxID=57060 RepID=UPI00346195BA
MGLGTGRVRVKCSERSRGWGEELRQEKQREGERKKKKTRRRETRGEERSLEQKRRTKAGKGAIKSGKKNKSSRSDSSTASPSGVQPGTASKKSRLKREAPRKMEDLQQQIRQAIQLDGAEWLQDFIVGCRSESESGRPAEEPTRKTGAAEEAAQEGDAGRGRPKRRKNPPARLSPSPATKQGGQKSSRGAEKRSGAGRTALQG